MKEFGPGHAVFNLSKLGIRYFRLFLKAKEESKNNLVEYFTIHPNVGWIFTASGYINLGIGFWVRTNSEINDISTQIRNILSIEDEIVFQTEPTSLHGFTYMDKERHSFCMVDSTLSPIAITPLEQDYIKLLAIDSTVSNLDMSKVLNVKESEIANMKHELEEKGIIVNYKKRINFEKKYFKVIIDTKSRVSENSFKDLEKMLWESPECIYICKVNSKYDYEFEIILDSEEDLKKYLVFFTDYKTAILEENIYANLYPDNKIANFNLIKDNIKNQNGNVVDLRNSKIWYLNYEGTKAYINIYEDKKYFKEMNEGEVSLFDDIAKYISSSEPKSIFNIVDIGSGNGMKGKLFIESIGESTVKAYYPIDLQIIELEFALNVHRDGKYAKHPVFLDLENMGARFPVKTTPGEKNINIFLGGTYGNFDHHTINQNLKKLINNQDYLLVTMSISAGTKSDEELIAPYMNMNAQKISLGTLEQIGFNANQFETNKDYPELVLHYKMENRRATSFFILKDDVEIDGKKYSKGTEFKILSSWKPNLDEFKSALETDFVVEKMFYNDVNAIALIKNLK